MLCLFPNKNVILALALTALMLTATTVSAATLDVCATCGYRTVTSALDAAHDGDTIRVAAGVYAEEISLQKNGALNIFGGYSADFSQHDPAHYKSRVQSFSINNSNTSNIRINGFEIVGSTYCGVYVSSASSDVSVEDCDIHNNNYIGIFFTQFHHGTMRGNTIHNNGWRSGVTVGYGNYEHLEILDNEIFSYTGDNNWAIELNSIHDGDVLSGNNIHNNRGGIIVRAGAATYQTIFQGNTIHDNMEWGVSMYSGAPIVQNNVFYLNLFGAMYYAPVSADSLSAFDHNVFSDNGTGIRIEGPRGQTEINDNVFDHNEHTGAEITALGLWGATNIVVRSLRNNAFARSRGPKFSHSSMAPAYSFNSESPGDWNEMNQFSWTSGNFAVADAHFQNPAAHDFTLRSDSFLIDEAAPDEDASSEPAPNGGRVNVGLNGGTADAMTSPAAIAVRNVSISQDGDDLLLHFGTTTDTSDYWIFVDWMTPDGYEPISATSLSGIGYVVGYRGGRTAAGTDRALRFLDAVATMRELGIDSTRVRVRIEHGNESATAESPNTSVNLNGSTLSVGITSLVDDAVLTTARPDIRAEVDAEGSPVTRVTFAYQRTGGSEWTTFYTASSGPYVARFGTGSLPAGMSYNLRVHAENAAGKNAEAIVRNIHICNFVVSPRSLSANPAGSSTSITVTASNPECPWSVSTRADWITSSVTAAHGSGHVTLTFGANTKSTSRSAEPLVAGLGVNVSQARISLPDLTASISSVKKDSKKNLQVSFQCSNKGEGTSAATNVQVFLTSSSSARKVGTKDAAQTVMSVKKLSPGRSQSFSLKLTARQVGSSKYIAVVCDGAGSVKEKNESNNTVVKKF